MSDPAQVNFRRALNLGRSQLRLSTIAAQQSTAVQITLDKWFGSYESKAVTEFRALANKFQPVAYGPARLWWHAITLAARWRGW